MNKKKYSVSQCGNYKFFMELDISHLKRMSPDKINFIHSYTFPDNSNNLTSFQKLNKLITLYPKYRFQIREGIKLSYKNNSERN